MKQTPPHIIDKICEMYFGGSTLPYKEAAKILREEGYRVTAEDIGEWIAEDQKIIATPVQLDEARPLFKSGGAVDYKQCSVFGCNNEHFARGLCAKHYSRMRRTGQLEKTYKTGRKPLNQIVACSVDGCDKPVRSRGFCAKHHSRWLRHGSPDIVKRVQGLTDWERFNHYLTEPDEHGCQFFTSNSANRAGLFHLSNGRGAIDVRKYYYEEKHKIILPKNARLQSCCKAYGAAENNRKCVVHTVLIGRWREVFAR